MKRSPGTEANRAAADVELEALQRLAAVRRVTDAVVTGELVPTPPLLRALTRLLHEARRRFELAHWLRSEAAAA